MDALEHAQEAGGGRKTRFFPVADVHPDDVFGLIGKILPVVDLTESQTCTTSLKPQTDGFVLMSFPMEEVVQMPMSCPSCGASRLVSRHHGRKVGGTTGAVAGTASGAAGAWSGAEAGALVGAVGGPVGIAVGSIAGAVFGGLVGGTAGGVAGARLGSELDSQVLDNLECRACGHTFRPHVD